MLVSLRASGSSMSSTLKTLSPCVFRARSLFDRDGLLRTRLRSFAYRIFLICRDNLVYRRRGAVNVTELEGIRCDHRAQRVALAALRINKNLHSVPLLSC